MPINHLVRHSNYFVNCDLRGPLLCRPLNENGRIHRIFAYVLHDYTENILQACRIDTPLHDDFLHHRMYSILNSWYVADFRSNLLCFAWTGRLARLSSPRRAGPSPPGEKRGRGSPTGVLERLCCGGLLTNCLRTSHGACTGAVGGFAVGAALWVSPPGRADLPMRQQAADCSIRLSISLIVPCLDKWRPSTVNISSMMSPLRQRKLSRWFMNKQPLSLATLSIKLLTVSPFSAASLWSLLGVMPLIVTWPVVDIRFASEKMSQILLPIFSTGNFVEQSFVPTCDITSPNESVFILRRDCNISPILAPLCDTICNAFESVQATSWIIESPMRRLGMLGLVWGGWGRGGGLKSLLKTMTPSEKQK